MESSKRVFEFRIVVHPDRMDPDGALFNCTSPHHEEILEDLYCCHLCGSGLEYNHKANHYLEEMEEEWQCSSCGIKSPKRIHRIQ